MKKIMSTNFSVIGFANHEKVPILLQKLKKAVKDIRF